jgi:hypothetical protein
VFADHVFFRPDIDGVPALQSRVPAVEIVVVLGDEVEILGPYLLVPRQGARRLVNLPRQLPFRLDISDLEHPMRYHDLC